MIGNQTFTSPTLAHFPIYKNIFQSHFLPSQNQRYKVWHVFQTAIYIECQHQTVHQEVCQETEALLVLVDYFQGRLIGLYYKNKNMFLHKEMILFLKLYQNIFRKI